MKAKYNLSFQKEREKRLFSVATIGQGNLALRSSGSNSGHYSQQRPAQNTKGINSFLQFLAGKRGKRISRWIANATKMKPI